MRRAAEVLTDARLRAVKAPPGGSVRLRDGDTPGLSFRVRGTLPPEWTLSYTAPDGRRREVRLGRYGPAPDLTLSAARKAAGALRAQLRDGRDPAAERDAERETRREAKAAEAERRAVEAARDKGAPLPGTVGALALAYLGSPELARARKPTRTNTASAFRVYILPLLGTVPADKLTRSQLRDFAAEVEKTSPRGVVSTLGRLEAAYSWGIQTEWESGRIIGNPVGAVRAPYVAARGRRRRVLSRAELRALWTVAGDQPPVPRAFVRLLLLTGLRREELRRSRWSEIERDADGVWLSIPGDDGELRGRMKASRTRGSRSHRAPLCELAQAELAALASVRAAGDDWLFPGTVSGRPWGSHQWLLAKLRARVAELAGSGATDPRPWHWHDCRRTVRSLLSELRVPREVGERYLAHTPPPMVEVYEVHTYGPELQEAAAKLGAFLSELAGTAGELPAPLPFVPTKRR